MEKIRHALLAAPLSEAQLQLLSFLYDFRAVRESFHDEDRRGFYSCKEDFLLQNGVWFRPDPWPFDIRRGPERLCFGNAIVRSMAWGWKYIEGVALSPHIKGFYFPHAWNVLPNGSPIDVTWCNQGRAYLGVEFSKGRADDATWNGNGSVLQDRSRGEPVLQEPWTGEDFEREWPKGVESVLEDFEVNVEEIEEEVPWQL